MSEFLLVIPEGWTQLDWNAVSNLYGMDYTGVMNTISIGYYGDMDTGLKEAGLIPADVTVVEAKLIDNTYFLVRLG